MPIDRSSLIALRELIADKSLRITPAMAAGITDHVWEISELLA